MKWYRRLVKNTRPIYVRYFWDREEKDQDETEMVPFKSPVAIKWEINVSRKGKHVFATDGTIRGYLDSHIRDLILLFREKFPEADGYRIDVSCFKVKTVLPLPDFIEAAINGEYVEQNTNC